MTNPTSNIYFKKFCENLEALGLTYEEVKRDYKYSGGTKGAHLITIISTPEIDKFDLEFFFEKMEMFKKKVGATRPFALRSKITYLSM